MADNKEWPEPVAYRWKWDKDLEWHYADYLVSGRDYYAVESLYLRASPPQADVVDGIERLRNLVNALDGAFISSWQSTAAWSKELTSAREYLAARKD